MEKDANFARILTEKANKKADELMRKRLSIDTYLDKIVHDASKGYSDSTFYIDVPSTHIKYTNNFWGSTCKIEIPEEALIIQAKLVKLGYSVSLKTLEKQFYIKMEVKW